MEIENKIKDVWTKVELEPHLIRQIHESIRSEEQEQVQEKKEETSKSPNKLHQEALAAQMKSLSPEQQAELQKKLKEMKLTSRWLADSAMTTYFGKPAFHAYGNGNTRPVSATDKLKTHNINPHSGGNKPLFS